MFKADISNCFNQLHWHPNRAKPMGFMLTTTLLMLLLSCGFGVAVTPMIWGVIGNALNRKINRVTPSRTFTYVDDFFGAGSYNDTSQIQQIVHDTINAVFCPEAYPSKRMDTRKRAEILGILIDLPTATMRPKDNAIENLFYVLFSIDAAKSQPLAYSQCLASLINLYSQVMHGMRPFVVPLIRMTLREHDNRPRTANANSQLASEIWQTVYPSALNSHNYTKIPRRAAQRTPLYRYNRCKPMASVCWFVRPTFQWAPHLDDIPPTIRTRHTSAITSATRIPRPLTGYDISRSLWPNIGRSLTSG